MNKVAPALCIGIGGYWFYMGLFKYHLWFNNGPGGGLFACLAGLLLMSCGTILLVRFIKQKEASALDKDAVVLIAAALITAFSTQFIGMIPALGLFIVLWLKLREKISIKKSLLVGVGTALFLLVIFNVLLKVPLPMGISDRF